MKFFAEDSNWLCKAETKSLWSKIIRSYFTEFWRSLGNLTRRELVRFPNLLYVSRRIWQDKNMQLSNLIDTISLKQLGNLLTLMSSWVEDLKPFNVYHTTFPSMPVDATVFWQLYGKYKVSSFDRGRECISCNSFHTSCFKIVSTSHPVPQPLGSLSLHSC